MRPAGSPEPLSLNFDNWKRKRALVLKRESYRCVYCGTRATQVHTEKYAPKDTASSKIMDKGFPLSKAQFIIPTNIRAGKFARRFFKSMDRRFEWIFRS